MKKQRVLVYWRPSRPLREGLEQTYQWLAGQVAKRLTASSQAVA
jgi:nucleoside-diphosphate-sugar epimerase